MIGEFRRVDVLRCGACDVEIILPHGREARLRENGERFYCPNGHPRVFRPTESEKRAERAEAERDSERRRAERAERAASVLRDRIEGECRECGGQFSGARGLAVHRARAHRVAKSGLRVVA